MTHVSLGYLRLLAEKAPTAEDRDHFNAVVDEIERLRAENERLRFLITAWVDACEADRSITIAHLFAVDPEMIGADPSDGDTYEAVIEAGKNLRKAVGR